MEVSASVRGSHRLKAKTRVSYESILANHVGPFFDRLPVGSIDQPAVRRFLAEMAKSGSAPGTIRSARNVLRQVLGVAVGARALAFNPCDGVKVPRSARQEMHFLSAEQVEELAHAVAHPAPRRGGHGAAPHWRTEFPDLGLLVRFCAYTGLRAGEVEALRVRRLDLFHAKVEVAESVSEVRGHGLVFGPTKTYERRSVPVPRFLCDDLLRFVAGKAPEDFVFSAPEGGPIRHGNFYARHFKRAVLEAGLPETLRFHDLRHTYVGFLIAEGAHPRAIMERMGHSSVTVTLDRYGHLLPVLEAQLDEALDRVGRAAKAQIFDSVGSHVGHANVGVLRADQGK